MYVPQQVPHHRQTSSSASSASTARTTSMSPPPLMPPSASTPERRPSSAGVQMLDLSSMLERRPSLIIPEEVRNYYIDSKAELESRNSRHPSSTVLSKYTWHVFGDGYGKWEAEFLDTFYLTAPSLGFRCLRIRPGLGCFY